MNSTYHDAIGHALPLTKLISYQDGTVISRTLLDKGIGTITLFAFAAGQGLSEHTAPFDAVVQILDGTALVTIDGISHTVQSGEMIIMPAHRPHALRGAGAFTMLLTMIRVPVELDTTSAPA